MQAKDKNIKVNCLLVDDEPLALDVITSYIDRVDGLDIIGKCANALDAFEVIQNRQVDLLFLDIQMPKLDGIDFIKSLPNPPKVIFTTAYREYAIEAFDVDAVDYLLKPIPFSRFLKAVGKAYQHLQFQGNLNASNTPMEVGPELKSMEAIFVRADKKMVKILLQEILYIESLKDYVLIHLPGKRIITKQKISYLEEKLPEDKFLRIHRSFLVSLDKIQAFSPSHVEINEKELPIGRSYKSTVNEILFSNTE